MRRKISPQKKLAANRSASNGNNSKGQQRQQTRTERRSYNDDSADLPPSPQHSSHNAERKQQMRMTSRLRRQRRQSHILLMSAIGLLVFGGLMALVLSATKPSKPSSQVKRLRPAPSLHIDLSQENRLFVDGLALLKQSKYRQAEPVLRKAKTMLLAKRDLCAKDSKLYQKLDNMLEEISQAHYQAQKNIRLQHK